MEGIMKALLNSAAVWVALVILTVPGTVEAGQYSEKDLRGDYAFSMTGVVTFAGGNPVGLPTYAVGVFRANGRGDMSATRVMFNVAGCLDIEYTDQPEGWSSYTVDADGLGTATAQVQANDVSQTGVAGCPNLTLPPQIVFEFNFALRDNGKAAEAIGVAVKDLDDNPILAWGGSGRIERQ
jgi:hypothetical protein